MYSHQQLRDQDKHAVKSKIGRRTVLWLAIAVILFLVSLYAVRFVTIRKLSQQVSALSVEEQSALNEQSALRARLAQKDDLKAIEDVAREKLGLVKPGEQLIIFVKGD